MTFPRQRQGVSAVKALAVAAAQGQKIYTLNQSNHAVHASVLQSLAIDQDVHYEISDASYAGKKETVHASDVSVGGWVGSGYIVLDPATGAGAYKIAGSSNGGALLFLGYGLFGLAATAYAVVVFGEGFAIAVGLFVIFHLLLLMMALKVTVNGCAGLATAGVATAFLSRLPNTPTSVTSTIYWPVNIVAASFGLHPCTI